MTLSGHVAPARGTVALIKGILRDQSATEVDTMPERVDLRVHDSVALDEIELYSEVLSAVAVADRRLTAAEIDKVLGLRSEAERPAASGAGHPSSRQD
jgi:hypothetical protein